MKSMQGLTLVEVMIASALGLIVLMFVCHILITHMRLIHTTEGLAQANETGRLVMHWLSDYLIQGGYESNYWVENSDDYYPVAAHCQQNIFPPAVGANCSYNSKMNGAGGDRIAIRRKVGGLQPTKSQLSTCTGEGLPAEATEQQQEVIDVFWVQNDNLRCVTYSSQGLAIGSSQAIANGVESLQFLVGIKGDYDYVEKYSEATNGTAWKKVVAIRVAILTKEQGRGALTKEPRAYGLLDSQPIVFNDTLARQVVMTTIWFPNSQAR